MNLDEIVILYLSYKNSSENYCKEYRNFVEKIYNDITNIKNNKKIKVRLVPIEVTNFRDGEIKVIVEENVRKRSCFFIHNSNEEPAKWFLELGCVNEALKFSDADKIIDVLPYLKFSRQDRKDVSRVALNARVVAKLISEYANRVMTVDVHSSQIQGFYDIPFDNLYSFPTVVEYLYNKHKPFLENLVIMSPDSGGVSRAELFKNKLAEKGISSELAFGYKTRPKPGEVGKYNVLGNISNKNILIIDDIIDSGNTLLKAWEKLKKKGAKKVWAYATHGLFTEGVEKLTNKFDKILVSDSVYIENKKPISQGKLEIISLSELFGEAIYRTAVGESLSKLFEIKK